MIRRPPRSTLSLHDALPISLSLWVSAEGATFELENRSAGLSFGGPDNGIQKRLARDRKSTRLNSSHTVISYAVFCLKKKKKTKKTINNTILYTHRMT